MIIVRVVMVLLFAIFLASCKNNPYPADALFEPIGNKVEASHFPVLFLQVPAVMKFQEGEEETYEVSGITPSGKPLIEVANLPNGANFDSTTNQLTWTPGFSDADDFGKSNAADYREYVVKFKLYDSENTLRFVERESVLVVFDTPEDFVVKTETAVELQETRNHTQDIDFEYSDGSRVNVIAVYSNDMPREAQIKKVRWRHNYSIEFTPPIDFVKSFNSKDAKGYYKDIEFHVSAINMKGNRVQKKISWRVYDKDLGLAVFAPKSIKGGKEVFFTVTAVDKNGEVGPTIKADPDTSVYGDSLYISRMVFFHYNPTGERWAYYGINWKNIPAKMRGQIHTLNFQICGRKSVCEKLTVNVDLRESTTPTQLDKENVPVAAEEKSNVNETPSATAGEEEAVQ